jgi:hypothetical protein
VSFQMRSALPKTSYGVLFVMALSAARAALGLSVLNEGSGKVLCRSINRLKRLPNSCCFLVCLLQILCMPCWGSRSRRYVIIRCMAENGSFSVHLVILQSYYHSALRGPAFVLWHPSAIIHQPPRQFYIDPPCMSDLKSCYGF